MKKVLLASFAIFALALLSNCGSGGGGTSTTLSSGAKMTAGLGSAVETFQQLGAAMGGGSVMMAESLPGVHTMSANTRCTEHAEPGEDGFNGGVIDGSVSDNERYSQSDTNYALQKFYCTMASDANGPESISGAVRLLKTVACALEKQLGTLSFDNTPVPITSLTLDTTCANQAMLNDMGAAGASSVTMAITGTVTAALNPTFAETPANTHYSHGIRFNVPGGIGGPGDPFTFIIMAKFNPAIAGDPVESGDFEFATFATGTGNGQAVEYTAGKIDRSANRIWFEMRNNRIKANPTDPFCPADSQSCGWARHIRLAADVTFAGGELASVANFTGIIADSNDSTGVTGNSDRSTFITATGSLATGLTGKVFSLNASPASLNGASTITAYTAGLTSCVTTGAPISTSCGGMPAALTPSGPVKIFAMTTNNGIWLESASENGGIGFSGAATIADEQFAN